ncbi:uncharacterized protein J3D65DRAFT_620376 [Phyllosticta citribraziliensis]|uniref:Uncharacterized protein n=1 Tax=Phyllosticta citribraziliensis TaxID=989973 RepID=A0ABR1LXQ7_9PEZI
MGRIYAPGRWAAAPGDEIVNTSWYFGKAPWELELDEAEAKEMEEMLKKPVDYSASPICIDSPPRLQSSPDSARAPASLSSPKRRREDDNASDGRPGSPKRHHLIDVVPISPPPPAPAVLPVGVTSPRSIASVPSSAARSASVPPPSASPWVIGSPKRHRKDDNESFAQHSNKPKPKRIRLSTPRQLRASSAPPILVPSPHPSGRPPVSLLSSRARCSSVPLPTASPWVIAGPKRRRDDSDEGTRPPVTPKRVRLSLPSPLRAGEAPPVVDSSDDSSGGVTSSDSSSGSDSCATQIQAAAASPPAHQAPLSASPLPSDSSSSSPSASALTFDNSDNTTNATSARANS